MFTDSPHFKGLNSWFHPHLGLLQAVNDSVSSPFYQQSLTLRDQVLRQPLGLSIGEENLEPETHHGHFGIIQFSEKLGSLLACVGTAIACKIATNRLNPIPTSKLHQNAGTVRISRGFTTPLLALKNRTGD
ncbi:MAG: hypothetical protein R6U67_07250 [Sodalinema sp.]|uniref:hypothetical protein n=1 Tax=Sodalinema sp. TaxID=3080550 RepID=UPI00396F2A48